MLTIELRRSAEYERRKSRLTAEARLAVSLVEEEIAVDPSIRGRRRVRADGAIVDFSGPGILVAYRVIDTSFVELLALVDLGDT